MKSIARVHSRSTLILIAALVTISIVRAEEFESKPAEPAFEKFNAKKAPVQAGP